MTAPFRIARLGDRQLAKIGNALFNALSANQILVVYAGNATTNVKEILDLREYSQKSHAIQRLEVVFSGARVIVARGVYAGGQENLDTNRFRGARKSAVFDEVWVAPSQHQMEIVQAKAIDEAFADFRSEIFTGGDQSEIDLTAVIASQLDQLRKLSLEFHEKQLAADAELRARRESDEAELLAKSSENRKELERERFELEEYRKQVNDREPQHERRRLRELLTTAITEKLDPSTLSSRVTERKTAYWYLTAGTALLAISAALTVGAPESTFTADFWFRSIKALLAGVAGGGFLWAGLSHLKAAAISARKFEESALRYRFDMDRASWVVETILQMNSYEAKEIPGEWLEAVCQDLFVSEGPVSEKQASLDAFSALFDATARARLGTNGFEFEVDRKGAKRLAQG